MEKLLDLSDISLYPSHLNEGMKHVANFDYAMYEGPQDASLPIFTRPIKSVVSRDNVNVWQSNGIRPIIPVTEDFKFRLESCQHVFTAFTPDEIEANFISQTRKNMNCQFRIYIETDNGHDIRLLNICKCLKDSYHPGQVIIMGGPIANSKTYVEYCKAGFDFVRVGLNLSVDADRSRLYYPVVSLLLDIKATLKSAVGLKETKLVVDGGICDPNDILKCITLGADYVIIGKEFSKLVESAGPICRKVGDSSEILTKQPTKKDLEDGLLIREYLPGNWVKVGLDLKKWLEGMYNCFQYAFVMTHSRTWADYKKNSNFVIIS